MKTTTTDGAAYPFATTVALLTAEREERLEALCVAYGVRSRSAVLRLLIDQAFATLAPKE